MAVATALGLGCSARPGGSTADDSGSGSQADTGGAGTATGDTTDLTPPVLVAGVIEDDDLIRLTFSEPLAPVDDVDVLSFRMSLGRAKDGTTTYYDPGTYGWSCDCYESDPECPCYDPSFTPFMETLRISPVPDRGEELRLRFSEPVHRQTCRYIDNWNAVTYEAGLFVHFRQRTAALTDLAGNQLEDFGAQWALQDRTYSLDVEGHFPDLNPFVPIPCDL